ncbi:MAG: hypothetical protein FWD27_08770 [Coriobacteriia bacterium]|nr:hypothetical protein [Coriobacteriia bacterium]
MTSSHTADAREFDENNDYDKIILFALNDAVEKLEQGGELEPFTVVLHNENLHVETHPGEDVAECFNSAAAAVQLLAHVMDAYVFVYDGYITTDTGTRDAVIAERGKPGDEEAEAFAILYTLDEEGEGSLSFDEGVYDLGPAPLLLQDEEVSSNDLEEL